ncbi:transmembrane secretion effector [Streptomyces sp. Amel2xB2]|uniref:MFS transporter n=1 Tax=Streptomyces sp. Amel2xB2 TaxID=1305829 RepID=UPI000DB9907E|nr:MFS transporter [Streptomyces sp. Amel2xB2]RAJ59927.1 transmembrane secretion effector [Streptomyces sp. Amel2xB2]
MTPALRTVRPLAAVLTASGVSHTGSRVSSVALPWFVLVTTGSAAQTGLVAFCELAPYALAKALSGPLVDRSGPRVVSWSTDVVSATAAAALPVLHMAQLLPFWLLLALVAVIGAARGPGDLAKEVMVPEAADRCGVPLERATGLGGMTERLALTLGPALGGGLSALVGPLTCLFLIAACFALGSVVIAVGLPRGMGQATAEPEGGPGYWHRFAEGWRFLRGDPLLLTVIVTVGITNGLSTAFQSVLLPVWAKESGHGASAVGLNTAVAGAAAVCASLIAAVAAHRIRRRPVFFLGFLLAGAPRYVVLAVDAPLWAVVAVFAVSGFGSGFLNPILNAVCFERIPRRLLGRVGALGDSLGWAGMPLGGLLGGAAVAAFGLVPSLLTSGAAFFLTTNLAGLRPEWREMDRRRNHTEERIPGPPESAPT